MPPKNKRNIAKYSEDDGFVVNDEELDTKRSKIKTAAVPNQKEPGKNLPMMKEILIGR
jgi:hypothetical protein